MSHQFQPVNAVPLETARVARAICPTGTLAMRLREELYSLYTDHDFGDLFPTRGQPAACPWRLAVVTVLQFLEGLTDRQAAEAVRMRIDFKYLLGLELTDPGFHFTVLHGFRTRLVDGQAEGRLLSVMLERLRQEGLLKAGGRQRTDSTQVLAAVRTLNRLELVAETVRQALNRLAAVAPDWVRAQVPASWTERYSARVENARLPRAEADRAALGAAIGADGFALLRAARDPAVPAAVRTEPAVEVLRRVWVQQYYGPEAPVAWRAEGDAPPADRLIASPYDIEARYSIKRGWSWVGYKTHLTETCDDDAPHLIVQVETTVATTQDDEALPTIQDELATRQVLPSVHLVDAGYTTAGHLVHSRDEHGVDLVGPMAGSAGWQARTGTGFDLNHFTIDWEAKTVICPQGKASRLWRETLTPTGKPQIQVRFQAADCRACECRAACTRSAASPRGLTFLPQADYDALQAARERQETPAFKETYALRAGIESTLCQAIRVGDLRHCRYLGLAKTRLQQVGIAVALNLIRLIAWLSEIPRAPTRVTPFARVMAQT